MLPLLTEAVADGSSQQNEWRYVSSQIKPNFLSAAWQSPASCRIVRMSLLFVCVLSRGMAVQAAQSVTAFHLLGVRRKSTFVY